MASSLVFDAEKLALSQLNQSEPMMFFVGFIIVFYRPQWYLSLNLFVTDATTTKDITIPKYLQALHAIHITSNLSNGPKTHF